MAKISTTPKGQTPPYLGSPKPRGHNSTCSVRLPRKIPAEDATPRRYRHAIFGFANLCDAGGEFPDLAVGPKTLGGVSAQIALYVADADAVFERAVAAGAKVKRPLSDEFYGDRTGQVEDPFGHIWSIQTRIEDVSPKKMQKRLDAMSARDVPPAAERKAKSKAKPKAKPKAKTRTKRSN